MDEKIQDAEKITDEKILNSIKGSKTLENLIALMKRIKGGKK